MKALILLAAACCFGQDAGTLVKVTNGLASFDARTNHNSVSVKGKSTQLTGQVMVRNTEKGLHLSDVQARVPAESFATGMKLRNEHLKKYIFATPGGETPDLTFTSKEIACTSSSSCVIDGLFSIQGKERPLSMTLKIVDEGGRYRASGDGKIKLSDYGIERPKEASIQMNDEVDFHVEFIGAPEGK